MPFTVLLVCSGNTCRSAMAEGILRSLIPEDRRRDVAVRSAGTLGFIGAPATREARSVCLEHGIDIDSHKSSAVTPGLLRGCDLVLGMTRGHCEQVVALDPDAAARTSMLSEFANGSVVDIHDPIGEPVETYASVFGVIDDYLRKALPSIIERADKEE
jgi:protein-tyrosine-phosphatase